MAKVFVGIGSNLGDRADYIELARQTLARLPGTQLIAMSKMYDTEAQGPVPQDRFLNAVAQLETTLDPYDLLDALLAIETQAGRPAQRPKDQPRTLDLDILLYDNRVISSDELVVPHPLMHERWFVLKPLADVAPKTVHPLLQMTIADLLAYSEQAAGQ